MSSSQVRDRFALLVSQELTRVKDPVRNEGIRRILCQPLYREIAWQYSKQRTSLPCWIVGQWREGGVEFVYSEYGFGPGDPWGFIFVEHGHLGMDCQWYETLEEAYMNSGIESADSQFQ